MNTCYLDKKGLLQAFKDFTFDDIKKYYPSSSTKQYVKNFREISNDSEKKQNLFRITVFIRTLYLYFNCLWHPWKMTDREKCFASDIIDETYGNIEIADAKFKKSKTEVWDNLTQDEYVYIAKIKEYGKVLYGYLLAKDFLEGLDEIYFKGISSNYPMVTLENSEGGDSYRSKIMLRYNKLSIRGNHRVKLWDTFISPNNVLSRRALPGSYWNLHPEELHELDEIEDTTKKVKYILYKGMDSGLMGNFVPAIHPHIKDSAACYGGWTNKFQMIADNGYSKVFTKLIRGFLQTWTPSSPFWFIQNEFRKTYKFEPIKRRKLVNWSVIDSQWILKMFGTNSHEDRVFPRLLSQEKHVKGYYTFDFAEKVMKLDNLRGMEIGNGLSIMRDLVISDSNLEWNPWDYLKIFYYEGWSDPRLGTKLNQSGCEIFLYNRMRQCYSEDKHFMLYSQIFDNLIQRLIQVLGNIISRRLKTLTYEEIIKHEAFVYEDFLPLDLIIEEWKTLNWNKEFDDELNPIERLDYENVLMLDLIENYNSLDFHLKRWLKHSYELELTKLNNKKERYIDAIKHITNHPEQAQLFS